MTKLVKDLQGVQKIMEGAVEALTKRIEKLGEFIAKHESQDNTAAPAPVKRARKAAEIEAAPAVKRGRPRALAPAPVAVTDAPRRGRPKKAEDAPVLAPIAKRGRPAKMKVPLAPMVPTFRRPGRPTGTTLN